MIVVITGTNTDVGKTVATAALAVSAQEAGWDVVVAKPVQTGEPQGCGDIATIEALTGVAGHELIRYPEPLAPNIAARRAGMRQVTCWEVTTWIRGLEHAIAHGVESGASQKRPRLVLVEGAGGLLVRLADGVTIADIAAELSAPIMIVTSLGLGSLNAAELTVREGRRRGLVVAGLIGGSLPDAPDVATRTNLKELEVVTGIELVGSIPAGAGGLSRAKFSTMARRVIPAHKLFPGPGTRADEVANDAALP